MGMLKSMYPSPRVQLVLVAGGLGFKLWVISKLTQHRTLALLFYAALFYIIHDITALRVSLAISVYLGAFYAVSQGWSLRGGLGLAVNGFFHKQAFVAPLLFLGRWVPWSRLGTLLILVPLGLLMVGFYPGDSIFKWALNLPRGGDVVNALFGASYVPGKLAGLYDEVRTWPVVAPPTLLLAVWLIRDLVRNPLLFRYSATSILLSVLFIWGYAAIPEVQLRFWHFFLVPIVFIVGNARLNRLKLVAILILAGVYIAKYTTLHDLLLDQRTLSAVAHPGGNIAIYGAAGTPLDEQNTNFKLGSKVQIHAAAQNGFRFNRWVGDCVGSELACVLEMNQSRKVEAQFIQTARVTLEHSGPGIIKTDQGAPPCAPSCTLILDVGTELKLNAMPAAGGRWGGWEGACVGSEPTCSLRVNKDTTLGAHFVQEVQLSFKISGKGSFSIETSETKTCSENCNLMVDAGTWVRATPIPGEGQKFLGWTSGCSGTKLICEVEALTSTTFSAKFGH